jgi:hypothetical protein
VAVQQKRTTKRKAATQAKGSSCTGQTLLAFCSPAITPQHSPPKRDCTPTHLRPMRRLSCATVFCGDSPILARPSVPRKRIFSPKFTMAVAKNACHVGHRLCMLYQISQSFLTRGDSLRGMLTATENALKQPQWLSAAQSQHADTGQHKSLTSASFGVADRNEALPIAISHSPSQHHLV